MRQLLRAKTKPFGICQKSVAKMDIVFVPSAPVGFCGNLEVVDAVVHDADAHSPISPVDG